MQKSPCLLPKLHQAISGGPLNTVLFIIFQWEVKSSDAQNPCRSRIIPNYPALLPKPKLTCHLPYFCVESSNNYINETGNFV